MVSKTLSVRLQENPRQYRFRACRSEIRSILPTGSERLSPAIFAAGPQTPSRFYKWLGCECFDPREESRKLWQQQVEIQLFVAQICNSLTCGAVASLFELRVKHLLQTCDPLVELQYLSRERMGSSQLIRPPDALLPLVKPCNIV